MSVPFAAGFSRLRSALEITFTSFRMMPTDEEIDRAIAEEAHFEILRKAGYAVKIEKDGTVSKSEPKYTEWFFLFKG